VFKPLEIISQVYFRLKKQGKRGKRTHLAETCAPAALILHPKELEADLQGK